MQPRQASSWTTSDLEDIAKVLAVISRGQKAYGKEFNVKDTLDYFRFKLEGKFSAKQVVYAIGVYTDTRDDLPTPADLVNILQPEKPRITEAEYVHACKQHALEGYPSHGYYKYIIKDYEKQQEMVRADNEVTDEKLLEVAGNAVRRIGDV